MNRLLLTFATGDAGRSAGALASVAELPLDDLGALLAHLRRLGEGGVGQRVRVTGMAARSDALAPNELALLRYAIAHCVADARPLALLVVGPGALDLAEDQWVEVEGLVAVRQREGDRLVTVVAEHITPIDEPANPYLDRELLTGVRGATLGAPGVPRGDQPRVIPSSATGAGAGGSRRRRRGISRGPRASAPR